MRDLEKAKELLIGSGYTCVLCKGDALHTSKERGIAPMLNMLHQGIDLNGFSAADKVVGRAPAMLFILAGVAAVYAHVMTADAVLLLEAHGIEAVWTKKVEGQIINRAGTGPCPMELAVQGISDPQEALETITKTREKLAQAAGAQQPH